MGSQQNTHPHRMHECVPALRSYEKQKQRQPCSFCRMISIPLNRSDRPMQCREKRRTQTFLEQLEWNSN
eukprot:c15809_g1_i1 orf=2-205(-)